MLRSFSFHRVESTRGGYPTTHDIPDRTRLDLLAQTSPAPSSSDLIAEQVLTELRKHDVAGDKIRLVDFDIRPGVESDMGDGDQWPQIRERILPPTSS